MTSSSAKLLVPALFTAANVVSGFASISAAAVGQFDTAVYWLVLAILLDTTDGRVARWLGATSKFGQEVDSLSDAISFCAAPAFLVQRAVLAPLGGIGFVLSSLYLLAGVFRLARFNLTSDEHTKARETLGVPTPIAAGYIMAVVLMREQLPVGAGVTVVLLMAAFMVSRWALPEPRGRGLVTVALWIGLVNFLAVIAFPNWYTVAWWNLWNIVIVFLARWENRRSHLSTAG